MHEFHKFILEWNSTCFGEFPCPSSGVYSLYTQQWYMSYRFVDSCRAGPGWNCVPSWSCSKAVYKPVRHIPLLSVQWINFWWWTEELSETCRVSRQNKFVKLVHLFGFIIKKEDYYLVEWHHAVSQKLSVSDETAAPVLRSRHGFGSLLQNVHTIFYKNTRSLFLKDKNLQELKNLCTASSGLPLSLIFSFLYKDEIRRWMDDLKQT